MSENKWFTAKGIFLHESSAKNMKQWYEERIVLLKAKDEKDALKRSKKEAREYVKPLDGTQFLEIIEVWSVYDEKIGDKSEMFSSKTISLLEPQKYLETFFPNTLEDCQAIGEKHSWHNLSR